MNKVGESKAPKWFTDFVVNSFNPLARDVATLKQDMIEVKKDIVEIKQRLTNVEQRLSVIESLPTIQRELKLQKSK